jgi:hypothetical protein
VCGTFAQEPRDPRLDGRESKILRVASGLAYEPLRLGRRLIRHQSKTLALQYETVDDGAQVLPTQRRAHGLSRCRVENYRGGALIRNANDIAWTAIADRTFREFNDDAPKFVGVKFDLTGLGSHHTEALLMDMRHSTVDIDHCGAH